MSPILRSALDLQRFCDVRGWRSCFIGGLAVLRWGEPRMTRDVDLTVLTGFGSEEKFIHPLLEAFASRRPDAADFALRHRVLLLRDAGGTPLDVLLGALPFEERAVQRATPWPIGDDALRTCSAEDLVVHKAFAGRDQDWLDIKGILTRQENKLDLALVERELVPLLELKGAQAHLQRLRTLIRECSRC